MALATLPPPTFDRKLIDDLLAEHRSHPSNYCAVDCRVCLFNCAHHIQRQDTDAERARFIIRNVSAETINAAIHDVNAALGEQLVKPLAGKANV